MTRAFVIGNGPSLKAEQLDRIHQNGDVSFGVNRIHLIYPETKWRPINWVIMDFSNSPFFPADVYLHSGEDYQCYVRSDIMAKFFEWCVRERRDPILKNLNIVERCNHIDCDRFTSDGWHDPVCQMGGSVPTAIQLAVQMEYDPIYTIGMDGYKKGNAENNFIVGYIPIDNVKVEKARIANETTELALHIAKNEGSNRGVKLIDATVGGSAYQALPEVDFYSLFD